MKGECSSVSKRKKRLQCLVLPSLTLHTRHERKSAVISNRASACFSSLSSARKKKTHGVYMRINYGKNNIMAIGPESLIKQTLGIFLNFSYI